MAKVKFTAGRVDGFQCEGGKGQSFLWDAAAPGLGLRATANGAKSYMFQAKLNGQAMRITIGAPGTWTIQEAQTEARRLKVIIDNGQDPRQVKAAGLEAERDARDAALPRRNEWVFSSPTSAAGQLAEPTPGHKRALTAAGLPDLTLHGLRRSFGSLAEWTETPAGVVAQVMGHKPSAIAEKHYRRRPLDLLRMWHVKIEAWILEQAGIDFVPAQAGLRVVKA